MCINWIIFPDKFTHIIFKQAQIFIIFILSLNKQTK